nr:hypothetical protein BaRGS_022138 [Batillaria attramentaria]
MEAMRLNSKKAARQNLVVEDPTWEVDVLWTRMRAGGTTARPLLVVWVGAGDSTGEGLAWLDIGLVWLGILLAAGLDGVTAFNQIGSGRNLTDNSGRVGPSGLMVQFLENTVSGMELRQVGSSMMFVKVLLAVALSLGVVLHDDLFVIGLGL